MELHTFPAAHGAVRYAQIGDPRGPVVIFVHGFRGTLDGLRFIADELLRESQRLLTSVNRPNQAEPTIFLLELPGFGESTPFPKDQPHSVRHYSQTLADFIQYIAQETASEPTSYTIAGHSFGSIIAAHFAAKFPELLGKLVLINPIATSALDGPNRLGTWFAQSYYEVGNVLPKPLASPWLRSRLIVDATSLMMTKTRDRGTRRLVRSEHRRHFSSFASPRVVREAFAASISETVGQWAPYISAPTLLIAGQKDEITHLTDISYVTELFPHSEMTTIPSVGHLTHYETPQAVASAIATFIYTKK